MNSDLTHPTEQNHKRSNPTELLTLITSRRTIHLYESREVAEEIINEAVNAAHHAPNHKLTWPWRFTRIGEQTKARINELALKMKATNGPLDDAQLDLFNKKRTNPQLIVVSQVRSSDASQSKEDYAAVSCAVQNLCLAFAAHGVGSKWSTGSMIRHPIAYELAQIDADSEEIVGFIWFGYAARIPSPRRPEVSEVYRSVP